MKIGIISDTHDNIPKIKSALNLFKTKAVGIILHAGDFVAPFSIAPLMESGIEWYGVFGNNDGEKKGLLEKSQGRIKKGPWEIFVGDRRVVLIHNISEMKAQFSRYDVVVCGHTHKEVVGKQQHTLIINPGECGGWLYGKSTSAILDTETLEVQVYEI
jgi:putative phosphoesterase